MGYERQATRELSGRLNCQRRCNETTNASWVLHVGRRRKRIGIGHSSFQPHTLDGTNTVHERNGRFLPLRSWFRLQPLQFVVVSVTSAVVSPVSGFGVSRITLENHVVSHKINPTKISFTSNSPQMVTQNTLGILLVHLRSCPLADCENRQAVILARLARPLINVPVC